MKRDAYISRDGLFRYWLLRVWDEARPIYALIGSNPSIADAKVDDHTIRKEIGFGKQLGYGGLLKLNVGAFRATVPRDWRIAIDPLGPENTIEQLQRYLGKFSPTVVVAAWGKPCMSHRIGRERAAEIERTIVGMMCWGRNADGSPRHPLPLPYTAPLEPFN
jgi:hypothetical protein